MAKQMPPAKRLKSSGKSYGLNSGSNKGSVTMLGFKRPPLPPLNAMTDSVAFQWVDIDMYEGEPLRANPKRGAKVPGSNRGPVPVIRLYGVTELGNSVLVHVHGFTPYFICSVPDNSFTEQDTGKFRQELNQIVASRARGSRNCKEHVLGVSLVMKQSLLGYHPEGLQKFLQVYVAMPTLVPTAKRILEEGFKCPGFSSKQFMTYESKCPFILRFMIDLGIAGASWVEMPAGAWALRKMNNRVGRCQLEADIVFQQLVAHKPDGRWMKIAPLRVLSFDIECMGRKGHFPEADQDPVIQIASVVTVHGEKQPRLRQLHVLKDTMPIVGANVDCSDRETELLKKWARFVLEADVDVITGYNIQNFDLPYVLDRAKALKVDRIVCELGRLKGHKASCKDKSFSSSAYGNRTDKECNIEGRLVFDMFKYMLRNHKFSSYTLNSVSAHFLGQQKEDVHYSIISDLQRGSAEDRRRLAVYCLKDALLPQQLMDKLYVLTNYVEMARVTGVPIDFLLSRGQQIKVLSMLHRHCLPLNLIIPALARSQSGNDKFEGATVIEPKKGYYQKPIATLDFASLYPSIMQAHNLCYTTLLKDEDARSMDPSTYARSPNGYCFVKTATKQGVLPTILKQLLDQRKIAKRDMKAATDPAVKGVMNGRQLALKISANSVYGFTGATVGQLPCLPISSSVTAYGRQMIDRTKVMVEATYNKANGYDFDAEVIYGDTDSVMIKWGVPDVATAIKLGQQAAPEITKALWGESAIKLEFEKVYFPYLLMAKKRYVGLMWETADKWKKMDAKGIETVRRDNCRLVRTVIDTVLRKLLIDRDMPGAIAYTKQTISDLLQNKCDISELIISKALSKDIDSDDYINKSAHGELARRMRKRDPLTAPVCGDRVPYVMTQQGPNAKGYEKSEDPLFALENNIPIDTKYYLHNQLSKPLLRILGPVLQNAESQLLKGKHTRHIFKAAPKTGGLMGFVTKSEPCLGFTQAHDGRPCKVPISKAASKKNPAFCSACARDGGRMAAGYTAIMARYNKASYRRACSNELHRRMHEINLHVDCLCASRDCDMFFTDRKAQIDQKRIAELLERCERGLVAANRSQQK